MENQNSSTAPEEAVKLLTGELSAGEIALLKKANPGAYAITAGGHVAYFRKPNRTVMSAAMNAMQSEGMLDYFDTVLRESYLAGSRALFEDDDIFFSAMAELQEVLSVEKATLVKL